MEAGCLGGQLLSTCLGPCAVKALGKCPTYCDSGTVSTTNGRDEQNLISRCESFCITLTVCVSMLEIQHKIGLDIK